MKRKTTNKNIRLLGALLAMLMLASLFSLTAFAEEGSGEAGQSTSVSGSEVLPDDSQPPHTEDEGDTDIPEEEEGTAEDFEETEAEEWDGESLAQPSAAEVSLLDAMPYQVDTYADFQLALDEIILAGEGHIILEDDISLPDTVMIPTGVSLTISGLTGDEVIQMDAGVYNTRHIKVNGGELVLANIIFYGELRTGGIWVSNGRIELLSGAVIYNCFKRSGKQELGEPTPYPEDINGGGLALIEGSEGFIEEGAQILQNHFVHYNSLVNSGGGGVYLNQSTLTINGGQINGNACGQNDASNWDNMGGGILAQSSAVYMNGGEISGNLAHYYGGAIWMRGSSSAPAIFEMNGGTMEGNFANDGGAIYAYDYASIRIYNDAEFIENETYLKGGAIALYSGCNLDIEDTLFKGNASTYDYDHTARPPGGGAIWVNTTNTATIKNTAFIGNTSVNRGGALSSSGNAVVNVENCTFIGNTAAKEGGAIFINTTMLGTFENFTVQNTFFANNVSDLGPYKFRPGDATYEPIYTANINVTGLSSPFDHTSADEELNKAYNNFDISYPNGILLPFHEVRFIVDGVEVGSEYAIDNYPVREHVYDPGSGLVLRGWYEDSGYSTLWDFGTAITAPRSLYGYTEADTPVGNDVTFYRNHSSGDLVVHHTETGVPEGDLIDEPAEPVRTGYEFLCWTETQNGTGPPWDFGTDAMPASALNLYAQYLRLQYCVTFDYGQVYSGAGRYTYNYYYYGDALTPVSTTVPGYTFLGWRYGGSYWNFSSGRMPDKNITLVGVWEKDAENVSSGGDGGGTTPPPEDSSSTTTARSRSVSSSTIAPSSSVQSSSAAAASSAVFTPEEPQAEEPPEIDTESIGQQGDPLAKWWQRTDGWSILNVILAILLFLSGILQLALLLAARNKGENGESKASQRRPLVWNLLCAGLGVIALVLLPILENFAGPMLVLNMYTPLFLALAILHAALSVVSAVRKHKWKQRE